MRSAQIAIGAGSVSLALILAVLAFQYLGGLPPCEMCHWQRWPHIAAALLGIIAGGAAEAGIIEKRHGAVIAAFVLVLICVSGLIGAYQAGVEWEIFPGPAACTGKALLVTGSLDLNHPVVRCDIAAWRLFGISLAGYNALVSFATAAGGALMLAQQQAGSRGRHG